MHQQKMICRLFVILLLTGHPFFSAAARMMAPAPEPAHFPDTLAHPILRIPATRTSAPADEHKTLAIGSPAPDFSLKGIDGNTYTLASFKKARILVIVFSCNHCPTAQAYEDRIIRLTNDYKDKGVAVAAIMPNDPTSINLDELGYTDMGDSFEEMKLRAAEKNTIFPIYTTVTPKRPPKNMDRSPPPISLFSTPPGNCATAAVSTMSKNPLKHPIASTPAMPSKPCSIIRTSR